MRPSCEFGGHCLALTLLGSYLTDAYHGDIGRRKEVSARLAQDVRSADIGVRVDPQHRKIIIIAFGQPGEWRHAYRAFSAKRQDSLRAVAPYQLQGSSELRNHCFLRFDPILLVETKIARLDRNESGRSAVRWQHRIQNGSSVCELPRTGPPRITREWIPRPHLAIAARPDAALADSY